MKSIKTKMGDGGRQIPNMLQANVFEFLLISGMFCSYSFQIRAVVYSF